MEGRKGKKKLNQNETIAFDKGKFPLMSKLAELGIDNLKAILEITDWLDMDFLSSMAEVLKRGAKKYDKDNWRLGTDYSRRLNSAGRHLLKFSEGIDLDEELDENHLAMVAVNVMMVHYWQKEGLGRDDRPVKEEPKDEPYYLSEGITYNGEHYDFGKYA